MEKKELASEPAQAATRGRTWGLWVLFALVAAVTLYGQAAYVFKARRVEWKHYHSYDLDAHRDYFNYIYKVEGAPLKYHRRYVWPHFPAFYRLNAAIAGATQYLFHADVERGIEAGWFVEGVARVAALAFLLLALRRLFPEPWLVSLLFVLLATSPRVFFNCLNWNQDEYVFLFACAALYLVIRAIQDGLSWGLCLCAALYAALGFQFKMTMLIPLAALLLAVLILPRGMASWPRKLGCVLLIALLFCAVNYELLSTREGRARFSTETIYEQYKRFGLNRNDWRMQYLNFDYDVFLQPRPVTVARTSYGSVTEITGLYVYIFELYHHIHGPRTWINLVALWSGTGLFLLLLARSGWTLRRLSHYYQFWVTELYLVALVALAAAAMVWFSLDLCRGFPPHHEYVLFAYPAAVMLIGQQCQRLAAWPWLRRAFVVVALVHLGANGAVVARVMGDMLM